MACRDPADAAWPGPHRGLPRLTWALTPGGVPSRPLAGGLPLPASTIEDNDAGTLGGGSTTLVAAPTPAGGVTGNTPGNVEKTAVLSLPLGAATKLITGLAERGRSDGSAARMSRPAWNFDDGLGGLS